MPNHAHAILWFGAPRRLSSFLQVWKQTTSLRLKKVLRGVAPTYAATIPANDPVWQPKDYPFNLYTSKKAAGKLDDMHLNPGCAGLVPKPADWQWSSTAYYENGGDVGIPIRWILVDTVSRPLSAGSGARRTATSSTSRGCAAPTFGHGERLLKSESIRPKVSATQRWRAFGRGA